MSSKKKENKQLTKAYRSFDRGLNACVDEMKRKLEAACHSVHERITKVENSVIKYVQGVRSLCDRDLTFASEIVTKEMRNKVLMSQWACSFLAGSRDVTLDSITYGFTRFAFTICMCYDNVTAQYLIDSNIHVLMCSLMKFESELVSGPATMAMMHLSLHPEMRSELIRIQLLPVVLKILIKTSSQLILTQAAKLCASLALHEANKGEIAASGCFHILLDLAGGMHKIANKNSQRAACCAVVNTLYNHAANKTLCVELTGIKALMNACRLSSNDYIILQGLRGLVNLCYNNSFTGSAVLMEGCDVMLLDILQSTDILRMPDTAETSLACLANICTTEANRSHIGSSQSCVESALRICKNAREPRVVTAAANLIAAILYKNTGNKARVAAQKGIHILFERFKKHSQFKDDDNLLCFEKICVCLSSLMLYHSNHEILRDLHGIPQMVDLCKKSNQPRVVAAVSMILTAVVPSPDTLYRLHVDDLLHDTEKFDVMAVLKKGRVFGFGEHDGGAPEWLELALLYLGMIDDELKSQPPWVKQEYGDSQSFYREYDTTIRADSNVGRFKGSRGLIFSIY